MSIDMLQLFSGALRCHRKLTKALSTRAGLSPSTLPGLLLLNSLLLIPVFILNLLRPDSVANVPRMAAHLNTALP